MHLPTYKRNSKGKPSSVKYSTVHLLRDSEHFKKGNVVAVVGHAGEHVTTTPDGKQKKRPAQVLVCADDKKKILNGEFGTTEWIDVSKLEEATE